MNGAERDRVLRKVDALYDEYGRGPDGMLMPYVTHCYRAVVRPPAVVDEAAPGRPPGSTDSRGTDRDDGGDADSLLIDFQ
jgi:hypothetical protein